MRTRNGTVAVGWVLFLSVCGVPTKRHLVVAKSSGVSRRTSKLVRDEPPGYVIGNRFGSGVGSPRRNRAPRQTS